MGTVLGLLLTILILLMIGWAAFWVVAQMGLPEPPGMILRVIVGLIILGAILGLFTGHWHSPIRF